MSAAPSSPYVREIPLRWKDNDLYGHVNNVEYYSFFDTVINDFLVTEGHLDIHRGPTIGLCAESHCAFRAPIAFPGTVRATLHVSHLGNASIRYEVSLSDARTDTLLAEGWFVHVFVDRESRRASAVPSQVRNALERLNLVW